MRFFDLRAHPFRSAFYFCGVVSVIFWVLQVVVLETGVLDAAGGPHEVAGFLRVVLITLPGFPWSLFISGFSEGSIPLNALGVFVNGAVAALILGLAFLVGGRRGKGGR